MACLCNNSDCYYLWLGIAYELGHHAGTSRNQRDTWLQAFALSFQDLSGSETVTRTLTSLLLASLAAERPILRMIRNP